MDFHFVFSDFVNVFHSNFHAFRLMIQQYQLQYNTIVAYAKRVGMAHYVPSPQILVIHLTINVRRIRHVCHLSTVTNAIVQLGVRVKIVTRVSTIIVKYRYTGTTTTTIIIDTICCCIVLQWFMINVIA